MCAARPVSRLAARELQDVSNRCQVCGKGVAFGHNVSHSNRKTNRRWLPNVQKTLVMVNGAQRRINACTRCIRTLRKQAAGA